MRKFAKYITAVVAAVLIPSAAFAQASITGVVRDSSGGVLPGVTVEAASPVLIEKVRSVVTDGEGAYRIVDLRPGSYTVTFTLPGFNTVKREGVELTGSFTATINAELSVGELQETITVTGDSPTVDIQNTTRQQVLDSDTINAIPTGRNEYNLAALIPGVQTTGGLANQDVGGALGHETFELTVHGSKGDSQRVTMNGVSIGTIVGGGTRAGSVPNPQSFQEVAIDTSAASAELPTGGVRINFIPREGGNEFKGSLFASFADESFQGDNFTERVRNLGLTAPNKIEKNWDINPGAGGPIQRDRLWYYVSGRYNGANNYVANVYFNRNTNDPNAWTYAPDTSRPVVTKGWWQDAQTRLTWQVNQKNKLAFSYDYQVRLTTPFEIGSNGGNLVAPEAGNDRRFPLQRLIQTDYSSPISSRVLLEGSAIYRVERWGREHMYKGDIVVDDAMIPVVDQGLGNLQYRSRVANYNDAWVPNANYRFAASYITGTHSMKVGFNDGFGTNNNTNYRFAPVSYRFNRGVPNQITQWVTPYTTKIRMDHDLGLYAQDKWTMGRLALSYGARFDHYAASYPEHVLGPGELVPTRNLVIPESEGVSYKDITPKFGAVYDVFGTGKTALKVSYNKYLEGLGTGGVASTLNPINRMVLSATRNWSDANGNYTPDCDLVSTAANGECGALSDRNFGQNNPNSTQIDPEVAAGWGKRGYNWEFSAGVQQELMPRLSMDVAYFRRWYGNHLVTDNTLTAAADYTAFSVTAPADARLPEGGNYTVGGFLDLNPNKVGQVSNLVTYAKNFGDVTEMWHGADVNLTARLQNGLTASAGFSTGKANVDFCDVQGEVPEALIPYGNSTLGTGATAGLLNAPYCRIDQDFTTQYKGFAAYTLPRVDVQVSGTFQSYPGQEVAANVIFPTAVVAQTLGRPLSNNAANATVNVVAPGTLFADRVNQLDLRVGKILRFGRTRTALNVDLYNALNTDAVLTQSNEYSAWQRPLLLLPARFFKFSMTVDF
jgi:hypothetical protein